MKNKPFEMCMLFDFYGEMLTDKQKEAFDLYYNEDLSLSEIAEHLSITRQGVRDAVMRSENILRDMENKLKLVEKYGKIPMQMKEVYAKSREISIINATRYRNDEIRDYLVDILEITKNLSNS